MLFPAFIKESESRSFLCEFDELFLEEGPREDGAWEEGA